MAERVHVSVHIAVAAGAGVGRIALGRARRRGDDCLVAVFVRELRDGFGLRLAAARAGIGPDAGLRRGRLLRHFAVVPCVAECIHISIHVAVAAGAGMRRVALFRAGRSSHNSLVAVGMGTIIVMDVGGQKVIISIGRNRDRFPLRLAPGIVHIGQRCAIIESILTNARHAVRDRHAGQRCAIGESMLSNTRHAVRDRHARQRFAAIESPTTNARHAVRDRHARQRCAILESRITNARHAVRDRHARQRCAISESRITNARHTVRNRYACQRSAIIESIIANARHGHTFDCMRNIGFGNGLIAIGNGSCLFIEREIAAFHSIFHFPTAFTAVVSGCRFPGISFVSALTYPITTVRMRRFVLRTAVSMLLCNGHVTFILQPHFYVLSLMVRRTDLVHDAAITHNGIAR